MLLLWWLSMVQVISLSSWWKKFFISLVLSIIYLFFSSGRISPQFWEVFHKPTTSLLFSLLVFQQLHSTLLLRMPFQALLWQKLSFSSPFFNYLSSGGIVMLLSSTHLLVLSRSCYFLAYPFNQSAVSSFQVLFILSSLASLFNRSVVRICSSLFLFSDGDGQLLLSPLYSFLEMA